MSTRPAFYSALYGTTMRQHPAMMEACRQSHAGRRDSRYYSLVRSPTSKGDGPGPASWPWIWPIALLQLNLYGNALQANRTGALAYGSDDHILIDSNQDLVGPRGRLDPGCAGGPE